MGEYEDQFDRNKGKQREPEPQEATVVDTPQPDDGSEATWIGPTDAPDDQSGQPAEQRK